MVEGEGWVLTGAWLWCGAVVAGAHVEILFFFKEAATTEVSTE